MSFVPSDLKLPETTWKTLLNAFSPQKSLHIIYRFEERLAESQHAKFAVATNSCTSGILAALEAVGAGPGDEVVVPALSWAGTWAPVAFLGADPVPVDFSEKFPCMDPEHVERAISKKTKAVIAAGLWGQAAGIAEIRLAAKKYNVPLIIDAAQMFGATVSGKGIGAVGDFVVLSFSNTKSLMAVGEGGAVLCNLKNLYQRLLLITQHPVRNFSEIEDLDLLMFNDGLNYNFRIHPFAALSGIKKIDEHTIFLERIRRKWTEVRKISLKHDVKEVLPPGEWVDSEPNGTKLLFDVGHLNEKSLKKFKENCQRKKVHTGFCCYKLISELEPVKRNRLFPWQNRSINVLSGDFPCAGNWRGKLLTASL